MKKIWASSLVLLVLLISFLIVLFSPFDGPYFSSDLTEVSDLQDHYTKKIKPIFDAKCVACHSCYNSPCQLNLSSYEGLLRGAHNVDIYDFQKLKPKKPTRLYTDAHTPKQWRALEFYDVIGKKPEESLLNFYISKLPGVESGKQKNYNSEDDRFCMNAVSTIQHQGLKLTNSAARMPFGFPALQSDEVNTIQEWIKNGARGPNLESIEASVLEHPKLKGYISSVEALLNKPDLKAQIASRYLYEHLFLAHIYFNKAPNIFFRLVRSKTKNDHVKEIGTTYPFSDPKQKFYYRLRPVTNTITHKIHIPFMISDEKLSFWEEGFYNSKWPIAPEAMPAYGSQGSNPFETFKMIPPKTRYKFFLNNAQYHIMTFIKGPVCRGQTALNVINDHFWVFFVSPEKDVLSNSPETYNKIAKDMQMPAALSGDFDPFIDFRKKYWQAIQLKFDYLNKENQSLDESWFWYGKKENTNALLTIYRHFDSAMVFKGLRGQMPKTIWLMDYHVFESIYYNLAAGYNVYGPMLHQLQSRLYMEISRISSEDLFISLLPKNIRQDVRQQWSTPVPKNKATILKRLSDVITEGVAEKMEFDYPYRGSKLKTAFNFSKDDFKNQWYESVILKNYSQEQIASQSDISPEATPSRDDFNSLGVKKTKYLKPHKLLSPLAGIPAKAIQHLPDTLLLKNTDTNKAFTLIHNKDHYNVSMLFFENDRRRTEHDSLDILPGIATSYTNVYIVANGSQITQLSSKLSKANSKADVDKIIKEFGLSRQDKDFWKHHKWFSEQSARLESNESGWLDLNRYLNI